MCCEWCCSHTGYELVCLEGVHCLVTGSTATLRSAPTAVLSLKVFHHRLINYCCRPWTCGGGWGSTPCRVWAAPHAGLGQRPLQGWGSAPCWAGAAPLTGLGQHPMQGFSSGPCWAGAAPLTGLGQRPMQGLSSAPCWAGAAPHAGLGQRPMQDWGSD